MCDTQYSCSKHAPSIANALLKHCYFVAVNTPSQHKIEQNGISRAKPPVLSLK